MTEIRTTIKGGLPVIAKGRYVPFRAAVLHGDRPSPAEGGGFEDIEVRFLTGGLVPWKSWEAEEERINAELCVASTDRWEL